MVLVHLCHIWILYIYIPIWLNSNDYDDDDFLTEIEIYIPIWLNSNWCSNWLLQLWGTDLHSNMVKFKLFSMIELNNGPDKIYIPIWLNSNWSWKKRKPSKWQIYIPIWLNSNLFVSHCSQQGQSNLHSNMVKFKSESTTFHSSPL